MDTSCAQVASVNTLTPQDTSYYCDMKESVGGQADLYQSNLPGSKLELQSDKGERMRPSLSHTLCN